MPPEEEREASSTRKPFGYQYCCNDEEKEEALAVRVHAEKETPWIDAWIRWERDSKDVIDADEDEDDELPPPTETYSFTYPLQVGDDITLELQGFPSESEQIWNSTGLTLWPCSHYLCDYLLQHSTSLLWQGNNNNNNKMVVELGSGLGRCGLLAYSLLQHQCTTNIGGHVCLTDGDTDTLTQLRDNVDRNTSTLASNSSDNATTTISCHQLLWGTRSTEEFCQRRCPVNDNVNLILGSDLIYVPQVIEPLFETVQVLLNHSTSENNLHDDKNDKSEGVFLMAHSNRREGSSVTLDMVLEGATKAGLSHEIVMESPPHEGIYVILFRLGTNSG